MPQSASLGSFSLVLRLGNAIQLHGFTCSYTDTAHISIPSPGGPEPWLYVFHCSFNFSTYISGRHPQFISPKHYCCFSSQSAYSHHTGYLLKHMTILGCSTNIHSAYLLQVVHQWNGIGTTPKPVTSDFLHFPSLIVPLLSLGSCSSWAVGLFLPRDSLSFTK